LRESCSQDCGKNEAEAICGNDVREGTEQCDGVDDLNCPGSCNLACQCEEKGSGFPWWFVLLLLVLIGATIFYFNKDYGKVFSFFFLPILSILVLIILEVAGLFINKK
ncbi:MAG: hypothetical protein US95_C0028G0001, partial [Candidatus Woesebacteria bacterium GW2011_GWB1_38_5]